MPRGIFIFALAIEAWLLTYTLYRALLLVLNVLVG